MVVLPYDSHEQVTSGVLIEAVAAGVPVVATAFPHAVELLSRRPRAARAAPTTRPPGAASGGSSPSPALAASMRDRAGPVAPTCAGPASPTGTGRSPDAPGHPRARPRDRAGDADAASAVPRAAASTHLLRLTDDTGLLRARPAARSPAASTATASTTSPAAWSSSAASPTRPAELRRLAERYLAFLAHAQDPDGAFHNRLGYDRRWTDEPGTGDWWGRALWGLGTAAARSPAALDPRRGAGLLRPRGAARRSPVPRAMAFAALGAAEVLARPPGPRAGRRLLADAADGDRPARRRPAAGRGREPRLAYANAALAEALIAAGAPRTTTALLADGLRMLAWLLDIQTARRPPVGHSRPAAGGRASPGPASTSSRSRWPRWPTPAPPRPPSPATPAGPTGVRQARRLVPRRQRRRHADVRPGHRRRLRRADAAGRNLNQGAESTLALVSTLQHGRGSGRRAHDRPRPAGR